MIAGFLVSVAFGGYITYLGYKMHTKEFWILFTLFILYGAVQVVGA